MKLRRRNPKATDDTDSTPAPATPTTVPDWGNALQSFDQYHADNPDQEWTSADFETYLNLHN